MRGAKKTRFPHHLCNAAIIIVLTLSVTLNPLLTWDVNSAEKPKNSVTSMEQTNQVSEPTKLKQHHLLLNHADNNEPFGVWVYAYYNDLETYTPIKLTFIQFIYMLFHPYYGIPYSLDVDNNGNDDIHGNIHFYLTSLPDFSPGMKIFLDTEIKGNIDAHAELTLALEVHIPALLSGGYISLKTGYCSPQNEMIPDKITTGFSFTFNFLPDDKRMFQLDIVPELQETGNLTVFFSYSAFTSSEIEKINKTFLVDFAPATELHVTTIPKELKVHYQFGESSGVKTKIQFQTREGAQTKMMHSFTINPLPSYMSFDLTLLGERNFIYESDTSYDVTYTMESTQNNTIVKLELTGLPTRIKADWGLNVKLLPLSASAYIDLNMSDNLDEVALYFNNSEKPFMEIKEFPKRLYLKGYMDSCLKGYVTAYKYSGSPTQLTTVFHLNKWEVTGVLTVKDGYLSVTWGIPFRGSKHATLGFDTKDKEMLGLDISVFDTENNTEILQIGFDAIATNNLMLSWDVNGLGNITNFIWDGRITKLLDLKISVYYNGGYFNVTGSWVLGKNGSFTVQLNKKADFNLANITSDNLKLQGHVSLYSGRSLKIEWRLGETGYFTVYTFNKPVGEQLNIEFGYGQKQNNTHRYGFKLSANDFLNITRTIQWDTENGVVPRIWILGDKPLPTGWTAKLLWNYKWYEVT